MINSVSTSQDSGSPDVTRPSCVRAANGYTYALTMSSAEAAALPGLGRSSAYEMVANGTWPTPVTVASKARTRR